jgi:aminobenzoyl-glutamate transport protein
MKRLIAHLALALIFAEMALMLVSWLLSASMTEGVRSLLSSEGIRWFIGQYVNMLASPLLVWLLLLSCAWGCLSKCGLSERFLKDRRSTLFLRYREQTALRISFLVLILYVIVILSLTMIPHAILLSSTGLLFPSAFSRALIPVLSLGIILFSVTYGWVGGVFKSLSEVIDSLSYGIAKAAPLFILYILFIQLYESLCFVFN